MSAPIQANGEGGVRCCALVSDGAESGTNVCVDCGGHGWVEDFDTMSLAGYCKTCGGTGRVQIDASRSDTGEASDGANVKGT